jgi:hypothetical protein
MKPRTPIYGLLAEFETPQQLLEATRRTRQAGYREVDAFAPYPVEGLATELGMRKTRMPVLVLLTALVGTAAGFGMQYWTMKVDYPFDAGGRPYNSWPAFLPIVFEVMVLVASLSALLGMLFLNGLPQPYHPLFRVERFAEANSFRFFLCVEAADPRFDREATAGFLAGLAAARVIEVPN